MKQFRPIPAVFLILLFLPTGAAGGEIEMKIDSVPSGARLEIDGNTVGTTPYKVAYPKGFFGKAKSVFAKRLGAPMVATFYREGYEPKTVTLTRGPIPFTNLNGVYFGDFYVLQESYLIHLDPAPDREPATQARSSGAKFGTAFHCFQRGYFVTNYHVVANADHVSIHHGQDSCVATVFANDRANDLAILLVQEECLSRMHVTDPLRLNSSGKIQAGHEVVTYGYPLPLEFAKEPQVSAGIIKSTSGIEGDPRTFTISNSIQPGSSGGPLLGEDGGVIGVVTATIDVNYLYPLYKTLPQDLNFAVKSEYVRLLFELKEVPRFEPSRLLTNSVVASEATPDAEPGALSLPQLVSRIQGNVFLIRAETSSDKE